MSDILKEVQEFLEDMHIVDVHETIRRSQELHSKVQAARQAPTSGEPVALLRREIGESSWFDHTPVKPNTQAAENLKASPIMDYCEVYTHPQPAQQGSVPVSLIDAAYHHFCKLKADYPEFSTVRHTERSRFQAAVNQLLVTLATPQPPVEQEGE